MFDAATSNAVMTPTRDTPQQTEHLTQGELLQNLSIFCPERPLFVGRLATQQKVEEGEDPLQDHVTWVQRLLC